MRRGQATALVGAQFGSEGKGVIAYHLRDRFPVHVRTGGPNAGHTIRHEGRTWKMQSIPCGWTNPEAFLVIGAGALIDVGHLLTEIENIEDAGYPIRNRLRIDPQAGVIRTNHREWEGGTAGEMHAKIGSTGEGVGIARMARIARGVSGFATLDQFTFAHEVESLKPYLTDTARYLNTALDAGADVLLEGTQGSGLSLIHGPWPHVTSHDTNAAQLFADAGLSPRDCGDVILVARTYPIRVAGPSGPLAGETSFEALGVPEEKTTVTKKPRRIGTFDPEMFRRAVRLNRPTAVAVTFMDYLYEECKGQTDWHWIGDNAREYVRRFEETYDVKVEWIGTGGEDFAVVEIPSFVVVP